MQFYISQLFYLVPMGILLAILHVIVLSCSRDSADSSLLG